MSEKHFIAHIVINEDTAKSYDTDYEFAGQHLEDEFGWIEQGGIYLRDYTEISETEAKSILADISGRELEELKKISATEAETEDAHSSDELRIRNISADICSLFEDILDANNFTVPDSEREGNDVEARLYGETYSTLEDTITGILSDLCERLRKAPDTTINTEEY